MRPQCMSEAQALRFRGRPLSVRELQADDRDRLEAMLTRVTGPDLQMRFFAALSRVPPALLDRLLRTDPTTGITAAAVLESSCSSGGCEILAVARADRTAERSAEAALLVRSDLKGLGLGTLLLGRLIARCRERGITRLIAEVLRPNGRMLRLARKFGFRCEKTDFYAYHLVLDLTGQP
jgi:acetyltransferase